jgi:Rho-binding antiterminator
MSDDDYTPIDCGLYSRYEVAIMHQEKIKLSWRDDNDLTHLEVVTPIDLKIHDGAEYLITQNAEGERIEIRLDRIDDTHSILEGM